MRGLIVVGAMLLVLSARAETGDQNWSKMAEQRAARVGELAGEDLTGEAAPALEVVRSLLTRAEGKLANDDLDALPKLFARIDRMIEWVEVMEKRMVLEKNADAVEQEAAFADDEAKKAEAELAAVEARYEELEAKGL